MMVASCEEVSHGRWPLRQLCLYLFHPGPTVLLVFNSVGLPFKMRFSSVCRLEQYTLVRGERIMLSSFMEGMD